MLKDKMNFIRGNEAFLSYLNSIKESEYKEILEID